MSSSCVFISITPFTISKLLAFEPIVFVSLFISWIKKSIFFPIGSSLFDVIKFLNWNIWLFSLVISSSIEHLSAYITTSCASLDLSTSSVFSISFILFSNFTTYSSISPVDFLDISIILLSINFYSYARSQIQSFLSSGSNSQHHKSSWRVITIPASNF